LKKALILALDSSTAELSVALLEPIDGRLALVRERAIPDGGKHGTQLPAAIQALLAEANVEVSDLTACVGGVGPGSFTGLRVGLATLKGLCYARRIPLVGVSSQQALALEADERGLVCTLLDARHGHLYAAVYRGRAAEPLAPATALRPEGLQPWLQACHAAEARLVGEGVSAHRVALSSAFSPDRLSGEPLYPHASYVARLASLPLPEFDRHALFAIEPHYVRASEAEEKFPEGTFVPRPL
jgi:tRNA threonylcarbamoyladenosine biosynthesis protein TsaB